MYSKNIYEHCSDEKLSSIQNFNEDYKAFLSYGKTERLCVKQATKLAQEKGFILLDDIINQHKEIKAGDKFNVSGEIQMDAKPKNVNKEKKIEEVEKNE